MEIFSPFFLERAVWRPSEAFIAAALDDDVRCVEYCLIFSVWARTVDKDKEEEEDDDDTLRTPFRRPWRPAASERSFYFSSLLTEMEADRSVTTNVHTICALSIIIIIITVVTITTSLCQSCFLGLLCSSPVNRASVVCQRKPTQAESARRR